MAQFDVSPVLQGDSRKERILANVTRKVKRLKAQPIRMGQLTVCGYSPSLAWTIKHIKAPVLTTSGAHDFLVRHGLKPNWHVEVDPREHKAAFLQHPQNGVVYCLASTCHPKVFEAVQHHPIRMWHPMSEAIYKDEELYAMLRKDGLLLQGGSNVGLRGLAVGYALGFRRFALHGMDCSYRRDWKDELQVWAGEHSGATHYPIKVRCNDKVFETSPPMINAADELFLTVFGMMRDCKVEIFGEGLVQERVKLARVDSKLALSENWWEPVGWTRKKVAKLPGEQISKRITDSYRLAMNAVHKDYMSTYGCGGEDLVPIVRDLMEKHDTKEVLDYGCGKGMLQHHLGFEIACYDPCTLGMHCAYDEPEPASIVVCRDVLSSVEPQCFDAVMKHIKGLTKVCLLVEVPTVQTAPIPSSVVREEEWWMEVFGAYFGTGVTKLEAPEGKLRVLIYPPMQSVLIDPFGALQKVF